MRIYRISFHGDDKTYQLHAERVAPAELPGFVEISGLLFDAAGGVVIDPAEETLKTEFGEVERLLVPLYRVIRVDQVRQRGQNRILDRTASNVTPFPHGPGVAGS